MNEHQHAAASRAPRSLVLLGAKHTRSDGTMVDATELLAPPAPPLTSPSAAGERDCGRGGWSSDGPRIGRVVRMEDRCEVAFWDASPDAARGCGAQNADTDRVEPKVRMLSVHGIDDEDGALHGALLFHSRHASLGHRLHLLSGCSHNFAEDAAIAAASLTNDWLEVCVPCGPSGHASRSRSRSLLLVTLSFS